METFAPPVPSNNPLGPLAKPPNHGDDTPSPPSIPVPKSSQLNLELKNQKKKTKRKSKGNITISGIVENIKSPVDPPCDASPPMDEVLTQSTAISDEAEPKSCTNDNKSPLTACAGNPCSLEQTLGWPLQGPYQCVECSGPLDEELQKKIRYNLSRMTPDIYGYQFHRQTHVCDQCSRICLFERKSSMFYDPTYKK
eukprot:CAMPEP_0117871616 /NCGR_PEP_ID=MMETSP0950-20121206/10610_1 /TAXON_ID=44440 /ORGANISM="Chattonella subsalsa, Strain CCMP2191" /LENGTH=195 /DNA_ID=CAMNT_0005724265 /DNA_START=208 /DNA_END=795 /DNA_ORIENTATION=+